MSVDPPTMADDGSSVARVAVHSSLMAGERISLEVVADDGSVITTVSAPVNDAGDATFSSVPVAAPRVTMHVTGQGVCGIGRADTALAVKGGGVSNAGCVLALDPAPEHNAYYAAMGVAGVLSEVSDPDPAAPGYQTTVHVMTAPGWTAEMFEATGDGAGGGLGSSTSHATSIGKVTADAGGVAARALTVADGEIGFSAVCHGPAGQSATSATTTVLADTTPPACAFVSPLPGTTITPGLVSPAAKPGQPISLPLTAHAGDGDAVGEQVTVDVTHPGTPDSHDGGPAAADGTFLTKPFLFMSGTYNVALTMRDHAGNVCTSDVAYDVVTNGCEIRLVSPTTAVHSDADGNPSNGLQADVQINVSKACASRPVQGVCGLSAPSTFAGADGIARMRVELCTASPCQTQAVCTFKVTNAAGVVTQTAALISYDDQL
ncbi:MAG TPA: hypothetical protein VFP84_06985 [Kofleriaceae bacterium]|nr:hypothetical protein [Kofleriaceae bacterium]